MHSHILSNSNCCSGMMGNFADPRSSMNNFEDACGKMIVSNSAAGNLPEVQTLQNKFNKLQETLHKTNVAKCQATQAAKHWQKACLAARAHNNLLTPENHQLKQGHQTLGDWLAGTTYVPKLPKQPTCAPPRRLLVDKSEDAERQTKAKGKGK